MTIDSPVTSVRRTLRGLRMLFSGVGIVGFGISEAATGWIADGTGTRVFYFIACGLLGALFIVAGYTELFPSQAAGETEETPVDEATNVA